MVIGITLTYHFNNRVVYEEAVLFNLRKGEMAECHIAISKLLDLYNEYEKFDNLFLSIIVLFRFHYTGNVKEGLAEVSTILRQRIPLDSFKDPNIQLSVRVCKVASDGNYWMIKNIQSEEIINLLNSDLMILIDLICESCKKNFVGNIIRSYPIVSISWIRILLHTDESTDTLKVLLESFSDVKNVEMNESGDKFVFKRKK